MWRWRLLSVFLMLAGAGLLALGIHIEIQVQREKGSGFGRWLAHVFFTDDIEGWREYSFHLMAIGPGILVVGIALWAFLSWRRRVRDAKDAEEALRKLGPKASKAVIKDALSSHKVRKALTRKQAALEKQRAKS